MIKTKNSLIYSFFERLNSTEIEYVHFKSNLYLEKSFHGKTDFDILVHKDYYMMFHKLLIEFGAKPRYGTFNTVYIGTEHYLLYDKQFERMYHLHVHYDLIFGREDEKNYYFPDQEDVLCESKIHHTYPVKITSPRFELLLLTLRILLKFAISRSIFKQIVRGYKISSGMKAELDDLLQRVDMRVFEEWINYQYPLFSQNILEFLESYELNSTISIKLLIKLSSKLRKVLIPFQRTDAKTASKMAKLRRMSKENNYRWLPSGGRIISFIGADGAGKSSLAKDVSRWLKYKLSSKYIYFGQMKSSKSLRIIKYFIKMLNRFGLKRISCYLRDYRFVIYAKERHKNQHEAANFAQNGGFVITDRYPLREFWDMPYPMDGPRLPESSYFYRTERSIYDQIEPYPDIVIVLDVDFQTSARRTKDLSNENIVKQRHDKISAVKRLGESGLKKLYVIDANQPYEKVCREAKEIIWENI